MDPFRIDGGPGCPGSGQQVAALETREDQNPIADIPASVGTALEGQVVGTPPGLLHSFPSLHAPSNGGQGAGGVRPPIW